MRYFVTFSAFLILFIFRILAVKQPSFSPGSRIKITANLREEPKVIGNTQRFSLAGIKVTTWKYPEYHYGEKLIAVGTVKNSGLELPEITATRENGENQGGGVMKKVFEFRRRIEETYKKVLPEPQGSLLSGIVLGSKSGMPKDFYNNLRQTGTIHMMVASGMNVTIVGMTTLSLALLFLSRKIAVMLSLILIWFYVLLAGGEAPVVRAGIMGSLVFLAQIAGREADAWRGLILAAGILLFLNPLSFFDLGFQLSFAATAGILLFTPWFNSHLSRFPNQIKIDLSQTMGAQIATMPIILLNFGYYSSLSPLANVLIVSTLPWIMRLGLLGVLFWPILYLTLPLLTYVVKVIEWFGK